MSATTPEQHPRSTRAHRWLARLSFVLAGLAVVLLVVVAGLKGLIVYYAFRHLLWVAIATAAIWLLASITARNLKSGGGKVEKFDLKRKAEALGAEVFLVGGSGHIDVAGVARKAI